MRFRCPIFSLVLLVALSFVAMPLSAAPGNSLAAITAGKISIQGVPNAGRVTGYRYRGAQPSLNDLPELKKLGVTTIIDLRAEFSPTAEKERIRAEALGVHFLRIPLGGCSTPSNTDFAHFFQVIRDSRSGTVLVRIPWLLGGAIVLSPAYHSTSVPVRT